MITQWFKQPITKATGVTNNGGVNMHLMNGNVILYSQSPETFTNEGYRANSIVKTCVDRTISRALELEWRLYKVDSKKTAKQFKKAVYSTKDGKFDSIKDFRIQKAQLQVNDNLTEIELHDILELFDKPNPYQTGAEFEAQCRGWYKILGECIIYVNRSTLSRDEGSPLEMFCLPPPLIRVVAGKFMGQVEKYVVNLTNEEFLPENIIHIKRGIGYEPYLAQNNLRGYSDLAACFFDIQADNEGAKSSIASYQNQGAAGALWLKQDQWNQIASEESPEIQQAIKDKIRQEYFSGSNSRGSVVLASHEIGWTQFGLSPVDLNINEGRGFSAERIALALGYPPILLSTKTGALTGNDRKEANISHLRDTVIPMEKDFEAAYHEGIIKYFEKRDKVNYIYTPDFTQFTEFQINQKELVEWMRNASVYTNDEIRAALGDDTMNITGLTDVVLVNRNLASLENVVKAVISNTQNQDNQNKDNAKPNNN